MNGQLDLKLVKLLKSLASLFKEYIIDKYHVSRILSVFTISISFYEHLILKIFLTFIETMTLFPKEKLQLTSFFFFKSLTRAIVNMKKKKKKKKIYMYI
jgi:hypothetical protein